MNDNQKSAFETVTIAVSIVTVLLGILVWFISLVHSSLEETRLKHETCMVVTTQFTTNNAPATEVVEYCGPQLKEITK